MSYDPNAREIAQLYSRIHDLEKERDQLAAELAKVKRDIGWTMDHLRIANLIFHSDEIPAGTDPAFAPDPEDTARLAFINQHGSVSRGSGDFLFAVPIGRNIDEETIPQPYNIRHLLDIARRSMGLLPAPTAAPAPENQMALPIV